MSNETHKQYLGDGLYASYDGAQVVLRTEPERGEQVIYLDWLTYAALVRYHDSLIAKLDAEQESEATQ